MTPTQHDSHPKPKRATRYAHDVHCPGCQHVIDLDAWNEAVAKETKERGDLTRIADQYSKVTAFLGLNT